VATKYVRKTGSDSNGGTSPSDAWLTINKALTTMASGDTCYVGAGTYREVVPVTISPAAETKLIGDLDGTHTGDAGAVIWTGFLTNDKTVASTSPTVTLNGKDFLTFQNLVMVCGDAATAVISGGTATSTNITVKDCSIVPAAGIGISITTAFGTQLHWLIDRCTFGASWQSQGSLDAVIITAPTGVGSDYDIDVIIQNCLVNDGQIRLITTGTSANKPGGLIIRNCTLVGHTSEANFNSTRLSTSITSSVKNCFFWTSTGIATLTSGHVVEDYNVFACAVPHDAAVSSGAHSINDSSYAPMINMGNFDRLPSNYRPMFEPTLGSPMLGFGDDGNAPSVDLLNRPRPCGGQSALKAAGCLERGNTWVRETGTVRTGSNALSCIGPAIQDFEIPVDVSLTTVSVYARYDSTYAGTKPTMKVLFGGEAGVADATAAFGTGSSDADPGANAWGKLQLAFTPGSAGIVTIRMVSADTNGGGKAIVDDFSVA